MTNPAPGTALQRLWIPGPHLGWTFTDRNQLRQNFPEQPPQPPAPATDAPAPSVRPAVIAGVLGFGVSFLLYVCGFAASGPGGSLFGEFLYTTAFLFAVLTAGLVTVFVVRNRTAGASPARAQKQYAQAVHDWNMRKAAHDQAETLRLASIPEWHTARLYPDPGRLHVIGGDLFGWEAFLTVAGMSYLATHGPATIVDLTGEAVCRELVTLCAENGVNVDLQLLPADLDVCNLLEGMTGEQLIDVLVEAIHGDNPDRRTDKAIDTRILSTIATAIPALTMARLAAALELIHNPSAPANPELTVTQRQAVGDLFGDDFRRDHATAVSRLEAHLYPLRTLTGQPRPQATVSALAFATDGTTARTDLLADLIGVWLNRRITTVPDQVRSLVIAGADLLPARHVARLSDACARRGVRLILMWRHLRDNTLLALGGGPVAFMRLASHDQAAHAADFIGREHKFEITSLTHNTGGSTTHSDATSDTYSKSKGGSVTSSRIGKIADLVRHARDWSEAEAATWSAGRSWGRTTSIAQATSFGDATTHGRVHEHRVAPETLMALPDYCMLLIQRTSGTTQVTAVDCNPDLVNMPGVSMQPHTTAAPSQTGPAQPGHGHIAYGPTASQAAAPQLSTQHIPVQRAEAWTDDRERQW